MYSSMLLVLGQIDHFSRSERRVLERLQQTQDILEARLGRSVNTEDLSQLSGLTPERIRKVEARVVETVALDSVASETPLESPLHGEDHVSFGGTVAEVLDSEGKDPLAVLLSAENTLLIEQSLDRLPEREYEAVVSSFYDGLTLRQVGDRLGVSEARASQLRTRGLRRMRKFLSLFQ
jgi:RNA polymerase sigma factor for flagellar operon FliA